MKLTNADILEFQTMCLAELGLELDWVESQNQAIKLICLMGVVYRPLALDEYEIIRDQDKKDETTNEYENNHDDPARP